MPGSALGIGGGHTGTVSRPDWHADLTDTVTAHGAAQSLTLEEAAATIGLPGWLGEHGAHVAAMVAADGIGCVRN